ncbi:Peptidase C39 like family protein [Histomonas meleagridis]|uniref:Peptidase C39 like family protein n=1 Tax=Histomonas meleagridis TaxID=135588 RepID=UPI00355AB4E2|nr:Peptidase C39 like family protein [Histomonas meleagridis]KAH0796591.1 Peptidase C39 like family protein [Histomonas meleagridis]
MQKQSNFLTASKMSYVEFEGNHTPPKENFLKRSAVVSFSLCIVFFISTIALLVICLIQRSTITSGNEAIPPDSILPIVKPVTENISGAAKYSGSFNIKPSTYYKHLNFYNKKPTNTIKILEKFQTYQQTNDGSCGASAALMALNYLGEKNISEYDLVNETLLYPESTPERLENVFKNRNYKVVSSVESSSKGTTYFTDASQFAGNLTSWINNKTPVLVKLGGHWSVIIGYDDFGKPADLQNHVLILADSWDTHDHSQDGYIIYTFDYFWNIWTNMAVKSEGLYQQFVVGYK